MSCGHDDRMAAAVLPGKVTDGASRTAASIWGADDGVVAARTGVLGHAGC
jgi:hypothetical protein